jgi:hypothetical protein
MTDAEHALLQRLADDNARLRNDVSVLRVLVSQLYDPEAFGHAVSSEVRIAAKQAIEVVSAR